MKNSVKNKLIISSDFVKRFDHNMGSFGEMRQTEEFHWNNAVKYYLNQ